MPTLRLLRTALALPLALAAIGAAALPLRAQQQPPAVADASLGSTADSAAAVAALEAVVRQNPRDAVAWHRKGMLAWGMLRGHRNASNMKSAEVALARNADSSLRTAVHLAPDSAAYVLDLLHYFLNSGVATMRSQAGSIAQQAFEAATRSHDVAHLALAKDEVGMAAWRHYEMFANRYDPTTDAPTLTPEVLDRYAFDPQGLSTLINQLTRTSAGAFTGETDYRLAESAFGDALAADPDAASPRRHLYMLLAERGRWEELRRAARTHAESDGDADSWLAAGLAEHRLGHADSASVAFERGLAKLDPSERARYTRLSRLLPPKAQNGRGLDSARYASADTAWQRAVERQYWAASDPLSLTSANEHRNEFLARVTFAELRWSSPDFDLHGADTDRGDVHVRYGVPLVDIGLGPTGQGGDREAWYYPHGLSFMFDTPPSYGTARLSGNNLSVADLHRADFPVAWDLDARSVRPDSVSVQVARFRGNGDSTDVFVAAELPVDSMIQGVTKGHASIDVGFTLFTARAQAALRDSGRTEIEAGDAEFASSRSWSGRVAPGDYAYRVEGRGVASQRSARGSGLLNARPARGFGMSDVLLAAKVDPTAGSTSGRWTDFSTVPSAGVFAQGSPVAMLWETYDLGNNGGTSRYTVTVNVARDAKGGVGGFAARVIGGVAGAIGRSASTDNGKVALSYDRQAPVHPVTTDYLTLDLSNAPTGNYSVTVTVHDAVSGKDASSSSRFSVVPKRPSSVAQQGSGPTGG